MSKQRVLTIGAAVQDVFLQGKIFTPHRTEAGPMEQFTPGSKNEIEGIVYSTGGGATNAAVTFAKHGFQASFLGWLGRDIAGRAILEELKRHGIDTRPICFTSAHGTGYSVLLLAPNGERTILTYRGASTLYDIHTKQIARAKPDWLYISSLSGDFESLRRIIKYARTHKIKVAINPGRDELALSREFHELLPGITLLSVNKQEAQKLFRGADTDELAGHAAQHVPLVIITDGPNGSVASDGHKLYKAGMYKDVKVVDRTGAGDAFSSGFTAALIAGKSMEQAITFASANSTSVVGKIGAKTGILSSKTKLQSMSILVHPLHP